MNIFQTDETNSSKIDCEISKAEIHVGTAHIIDNPDAGADGKPHDLVFLSIARDGSELLDTVGLTPTAARLLADALCRHAARAAKAEGGW